ncbi:membrane dipeptidase [Arenicellales bacterium IMCC55707]
MKITIDCLQYCNWSRDIFEQMREGELDAVHVTIAYHEDFRQTVDQISQWNRLLDQHSDLIQPGRTAEDVFRARETNKTAIFYGFQNCSPIESDIDLVEICHQLGARFMQLSYNNQSLLATGCYESDDPGITRMGKQVIAEMNRVGLVVDMSHSAERSTLEAIECSTRPIAITHANPSRWHPALRNKSDSVLRALSESGGMIGFSLYPHHLAEGSACTLDNFCQMIADTADDMGIDHIGIGSDLCQDQPDSVVEWMRNGRWTREKDFGEGSKASPGFPDQPAWFKDNRDFPSLRAGLKKVGLNDAAVNAVMGDNWLRFFEKSFGPA